MSVSVAVMAHPKREEFVPGLVNAIGGDVAVVWDRRNDRWDTGRRALLAFEPDATHHLVIQDDAVVPDGLVAECVRVVANVPAGHPISLYMGRTRTRPRRYQMAPLVRTALSRGASFAVFSGPWWGVAVMLPTSSIRAVVEFGDRNPHGSVNYDHRIAQYFDSVGKPCYYTVPSIVDHRTDTPSLTGRAGGRRAFTYTSNLPGRWDGGTVTPVVLPRRLATSFPETPT